MVGAMNPSDSAADGYELDKATSNRITFLAWEPSFIGWCDGFKLDNFGEGWINEKHEEYANFIVQFITDNRGMLHQENDASIGTWRGTRCRYFPTLHKRLFLIILGHLDVHGIMPLRFWLRILPRVNM